MKKRTTKIAQRYYVQKLRYLWRVSALPREVGLPLVSVNHDDWCGIFEGKRCHCDQDPRLKATMHKRIRTERSAIHDYD